MDVNATNLFHIVFKMQLMGSSGFHTIQGSVLFIATADVLAGIIS